MYNLELGEIGPNSRVVLISCGLNSQILLLKTLNSDEEPIKHLQTLLNTVTVRLEI